MLVFNKCKGRLLRQHLGKIIGGLLAGLLVLLLAIPSFINWNQYRSVIEDLMSAQIGSQVTLKGSISATILPKPRITATDVQVPIIGTVQSIDMLLDPIALMQGQALPTDLTISGAKLTVNQQENGSLSLEGQGSLVGEEAFISPELGRMSVSNSVVTLSLQNGVDHTLAIRRLSYQEREDTGSRTIEALIFTHDVPIQLNAKFQPVGTMGNTSARLEGVLPAGRVLFSGRLDADYRPLLGRVSFKGDRLDTATTNLMEALAQDFVLTGAPHPFDFDFRLENSEGNIIAKSFAFSLAGSPGAAQFTFNKDKGLSGDVRLGVLNAADWTGSSFKMGDKLSGDMPDFNVDLLVQGIESDGQSLQQLTSKLSYTNSTLSVDSFEALLPGVTQISVTGKRPLPEGDFTGAIKVTSANPRGLLKWLDVKRLENISAERLTTLAFESDQLVLSKAHLSLSNLKASVDSTEITGDMNLARSEASQSKIKLHLSQVNFDHYAGLMTEKNQSVTTGLLKLPEDLNVTTGPIVIEGQAFNGAKMIFKRRGTQLNINEFALQGEGNTNVTAVGSYGLSNDGDSPVKLEIKATAINAVLAELLLLKQTSVHGVAFQYMIDSQLDDFQFSVEGTHRNKKITLSLTSAEGRKISLSGNETGFPSKPVLKLKGDYSTLDSRQFFESFGYNGVQVNDVLNAAFTVDTSSDMPLEFDGKIGADSFTLLSSFKIDGKQQFDFKLSTLDARRYLSPTWQGYLSLNHQIPLRVDASLQQNDLDKSLQIKSIKLGDITLSGSLNLGNADGQNMPDVSGDLSVEGVAISADTIKRYLLREWGSIPFDQVDFDALEGQVNVEFIYSEFLGEVYSSTKGSVVFNGKKIALNNFSVLLPDDTSASLSAELDLNEEIGRGFSLALNHPKVPKGYADLGLFPIASDSVSLQMDIKGQGKTPSAVIESLKGTIAVSSAKGQMQGINWGAISWAARTGSSYADFLKGMKQWQLNGASDIDSASLNLVIDGGAALLDGASINAPWGSVTMDGQMSLVTQTVSLRGRTKLSALDQLPEIPMTLSGSIWAPSKTVETKAIEQYVQARVESDWVSNISKLVEEKGYKTPVMQVFELMLPSLRRKQDTYLKAQRDQLRQEQQAGSENQTSQ